MAVGKGWEGVVLKLLRGKDFTFAVTGAEQVTAHYRRLRFTDGDPASLPAVNSLLDACPQTPATIWFETRHEADAELPGVRLDPDRHDIRFVPRSGAGAGLVERIRAELPALAADREAAYVWLACDTATTRTLTGYLRKDLGLPRQRVNGLGYRRPTTEA
ncbi:SIP domain-containing protein [Streptomyces sp. NPDC059456]|uniref:SIP domain-containing protein n=1 Tax=Streptomyces sp. NPDC059456 TaxID=3346838 RepID=UPI0036B2AA06